MFTTELATVYADTMQRVGMPACALTVELTESIFIGHDDDRVSSIFAGLKAVGVLIAVVAVGGGVLLAYRRRILEKGTEDQAGLLDSLRAMRAPERSTKRPNC